MTIEDLQQICSKLKGTISDIKWEDHLCFNVGGKMYLSTSPDKIPPTASFKTSPDDFVELCERPGIIPAPYLARYKWVQVDNLARLSYSEWEDYIQLSYKMVFEKLPKRLQKEILNQ